MLDAFGIDRAVLVGHSIAGEEMTRFAGIYPERTAKLVYLDAAYDRPAAAAIGSPPVDDKPPPTTASDSASVTAMGEYLEYLFRVPYLQLRFGRCSLLTQVAESPAEPLVLERVGKCPRQSSRLNTTGFGHLPLPFIDE